MAVMEWILILIVLGLVAGSVAFTKLGSISPAAARDYLRQGAKVIDVRSAGEYQSQHLPNAIHIPLGELEQRISGHAPNKDEVLLLHCLSGGRSGMGRRILKRMGYARVYNLGSFARARKIVQGSDS